MRVNRNALVRCHAATGRASVMFILLLCACQRASRNVFPLWLGLGKRDGRPCRNSGSIKPMGPTAGEGQLTGTHRASSLRWLFSATAFAAEACRSSLRLYGRIGAVGARDRSVVVGDAVGAVGGGPLAAFVSGRAGTDEFDGGGAEGAAAAEACECV